MRRRRREVEMEEEMEDEEREERETRARECPLLLVSLNYSVFVHFLGCSLVM